MARIIYNIGYSRLNRKIGGTTFQRNASGLTVKKTCNYSLPVSKEQVSRQSIFTKVNNNYKLLSSTDRSSWNDFAGTFDQYRHRYPFDELNGRELFFITNYIRLLTGNNIVLNCFYWTYTVDTLSYSLRISGSDFILDVASFYGDLSWILSVSLSPPVSQGQLSNYRNFRRMLGISNVSSSYFINYQYKASFGRIPFAGEKIGIRVFIVSKDSGQVLPIYKSMLTVL